MRRLGWFCGLFALSVACAPGDTDSLGGDDLGWLSPGDAFDAGGGGALDAAGVPNDDGDGDSDSETGGTPTDPCDTTGEALVSTLLLTPSSQAIDVVHDGVAGGCDSTYAISGVVGDATIAMTYQETLGSDTGCICPWIFTYTLEPLQAGSWTVTAAGDEATATVPE